MRYLYHKYSEITEPVNRLSSRGEPAKRKREEGEEGKLGQPVVQDQAFHQGPILPS